MEGLHDLQRGVVTELQPFITGSVDGARRDDASYAYGSADVEPGANLRFGFTNISIDATVNPDFSQVETDATQVTVNERFALFYPEKRPFFLEGIELFATPNQLVYTRQIADPIAGGKVTGKVGKTGVAFLSAPDDTGDATAWFNIARLRQDVGKDSLAGLTYTDRTVRRGFNRVVAADARIVFKKLYYVLGQAGGSWTGREGVTVSSPMWQGEFDRTARTWGFNYKLTGFGEHFETQSGYVPRNNIVEGRASNRLTLLRHAGRAGRVVQRVPQLQPDLGVRQLRQHRSHRGWRLAQPQQPAPGRLEHERQREPQLRPLRRGHVRRIRGAAARRQPHAVRHARRRVELGRHLLADDANLPEVQRQRERGLQRHAHLRRGVERQAGARHGLAAAAAGAVGARSRAASPPPTSRASGTAPSTRSPQSRASRSSISPAGRSSSAW